MYRTSINLLAIAHSRSSTPPPSLSLSCSSKGTKVGKLESWKVGKLESRKLIRWNVKKNEVWSSRVENGVERNQA
jgi:hypothetical protein